MPTDEWGHHAEASLGLLASQGPLPEFVYFGIKHHHERYHGGGQPYGLAGHQLDWSARLLSLIVHWDETQPICGPRILVQRAWQRFLESHEKDHDHYWVKTVSESLNLVP